MKTSDMILLGIYDHWPRLDDSISFETGKLAWVVHHGLSDWRQKNGCKEVEYPAQVSPYTSESVASNPTNSVSAYASAYAKKQIKTKTNNLIVTMRVT